MTKTIQEMYEEIKPLLDTSLMRKDVIDSYEQQLSIKYVADVDEIIGQQYVMLQNERIIAESPDSEEGEEQKENAQKMIRRTAFNQKMKIDWLPYYKEMLLVFKDMKEWVTS